MPKRKTEDAIDTNRKFTSYGSPNPELHYYAPREQLIETAHCQLVGDDLDAGGHYVTVWAPRQTGKTWTMLEVMKKIWRRDDFYAGIVTMQSAKEEKTDEGVLDVLVTGLRNCFEVDLPEIHAWKQISSLFTREFFSKPVILILDEFREITRDHARSLLPSTSPMVLEISFKLNGL
ncbi:MAG: hypothetical protein GY859_39870 [Desulfobacterales bacterium]|nr:hypothetical protein [Desulfobacterales bacterium]